MKGLVTMLAPLLLSGAAITGVIAQKAFREYPSVNHLLAAGDGAPGPDEYRTSGHVDESVIADMAHWISKVRANGSATAEPPAK